jgi:hypothetical protein
MGEAAGTSPVLALLSAAMVALLLVLRFGSSERLGGGPRVPA